MLVATTPVSFSASSGPITFFEYAAQVSVDGAHICSVYTSLNGATEANEDKLLKEIVASD